MGRTVIILILMFLFSSVLIEARDNPFVNKKPEKEEIIKLPSVASGVIGKIMLWQQQLNKKLTAQVKRIKDERSLTALLPLIVISFLYGVLHAAGPGHGKVVVFSYFISRKAKIKKGIVLGNMISLFHAVSGIIIVLALYFIIKVSYLSSFESISQKIKIISYGMILAIGIIMFINSFFNLTNRLFPGPGNQETHNDSEMNRSVLPLALAVGIVPCPGVVIIMLFALSFNLLAVGLAMSLLMAAGMAITITLAGIISILGRKGMLKGLTRKEKTRDLFQKGLTAFGSLLIILFGGTLLWGAL